MIKPLFLATLASVILVGCKPDADGPDVSLAPPPAVPEQGLRPGAARTARDPMYSTADQLLGSKLGKR